MRRSAAAWLLVLFFLAAGCGGGEKPVEAPPADAATPAGPASRPAAAGVKGASAGQAEFGEVLFARKQCTICHAPGQSSAIGADLSGLFGSTVALDDGTTAVADEAYLRESILQPKAKIVAGFQPVMPELQGELTDEEVAALVAYIKTLGK
jgi:cytochrome c oxidase subunit 2